MLRRGRAGRAVAGHHGEAVRHRPGERDRRSTSRCTRPSTRARSSASTTSWARRRRRTSWRFRFANGLFEPIWNRQLHRPHPDRHPGDAGPGPAGRLLRVDRRLQGHGRHPPVPGAGVRGDGTADRAGPARHQRGEEQGLPLACCRSTRATWSAGSTAATASRTGWPGTPTPRRSSPCNASIDNWRWAGVPFYLRTGKRMAEGQRIISIAFKEAPQTMFPPDSGVGSAGPDHLTFDLADESKVSLSFYGKRPGPGMKLDKLSHAVLHPGDRPRRRRARGLRAADPRRDARRPHPVHHRRGHREPVGALGCRCWTTRRR